MNTEPILVATDLSEHADEALRAGDRWARRIDAPLIVSYVAPDLVRRHTLLPELAVVKDEAVPRLHDQLRKALAQRVQTLTGRSEALVTLEVDAGSAALSIVESAARHRAALVVVGATSKDPRERALLGSTAEQVVRHAPCSVLVARHSQPGPVLVATDLSDHAASVVKAAVAEAVRRGSPVAIVHGVDVAHLAMAAVEPAVGLDAGVVAALKEQCNQALKALLAEAGAVGTTVVVEGPAVDEIVRVSSELRAGLLVIGTHSRVGLPSGFVGSVAQGLARNAPCSVLVVRAQR